MGRRICGLERDKGQVSMYEEALNEQKALRIRYIPSSHRLPYYQLYTPGPSLAPILSLLPYKPHFGPNTYHSTSIYHRKPPNEMRWDEIDVWEDGMEGPAIYAWMDGWGWFGH